jgi:hypothetical protein
MLRKEEKEDAREIEFGRDTDDKAKRSAQSTRGSELCQMRQSRHTAAGVLTPEQNLLQPSATVPSGGEARRISPSFRSAIDTRNRAVGN